MRKFYVIIAFVLLIVPYIVWGHRLTSTVSNTFVTGSFSYITGDYRPSAASTTFDTDNAWEVYNGSAWVTNQTSPQNLAEASRPPRIIIDKANINASASSANTYNTIIVIAGGSLLANDNTTPTKDFISTGNSLEIENGASATLNGQIWLNTGANFIVRDGGSFTLNNGSIDNAHGFWAGIENFEQGSIFNILNHLSFADTSSLLNVSNPVNSNSTGAKFGDLNINFSPASSTGWVIVGDAINVTLCDNLTINNMSATNPIVMFSNNNNPSAIVRGNITHTGGPFALSANFTGTILSQTLDIYGDLISSGGTLKIYYNGGGIPANISINLKGNLSVSGSSFSSDVANTTIKLNFNNTTLQTISVIPNCTNINMVVKNGASVQLNNQNLNFNGSSTFLVETNATFDFGFSGTTALKINQAGGSSNSFTSQQGSYLKITSPLGLNINAGELGNLEGFPTAGRIVNTIGTFHYMGKANQVTGNAITTASNAKVLICDLIDNNTQLSFTNSTGFSNGTTVSVTGGKLEIRTGQVIETETNYVTASSGTLYMGLGTFYKITKGNATAAAAYADPIPRLKANSFGYVLTGGTIELSGSTANNYFQVVRADDANYNYYNLKFSGVNTLGTDYKAFTSTTYIDNSLLITGTAVVDCVNSAGTAIPVRGDGGIVMDGGRLRTKDKNPAQPELQGISTPYNLTGGVIEFYATGGTSSETIEGKDGNSNAIEYYQIEVTGDKVGNSNSNITLRSGGSFTVKSTGVFEINNKSIVGPTGIQTVSVENGGIFKSGNDKGFHGFTQTFLENSSVHANIESIVLSTGSTVNYIRDGDQPITNDNITTTGLPLSYSNIIISGNSGTKTAPSTTLTVTGDFTKTGSSNFEANTSTVLFENATVVQNINNSGSTSLIFYNLNNTNTFSEGLLINANVGLINGLLLTSNSRTNLNAAYLTLLSTAVSTAHVDQVGTSASISYTGTGRFVIERYFPARRAWRLITAPVTVDATKTLFNSWQVGGSNSLTGSGTYISGPGETTGNGLDITPQHNYSLKKFDMASSQFVGVGDTKSSVTGLISGTAGAANEPDNVGYFMFVRGDRTPANVDAFNPYGTVVETTLRDTGKIQIHSYTFNCNPSTGDHRYTLIGNPYASPVDFANLTTNGVANKFWAWDPKLNIVGGYVIVDLQSGNAVITVPVGTVGTTTQTQIIQSKQAFLVETTNAASPNIVFSETAKSTTNNLTLFRPVTNQISSLAANLYTLNTDGTKNIADGVLAQFSKDYSDETDHLDALKFGNINETFSINSNHTLYMLQRRQPLTENDTIFLSLKKSRQLNYRFDFIANLNENNLTGYLEDNFLKTSEPINMTGDTWFDFTVNDNAASADPNRFRVVFKKAAHYTNIKATPANSDIAVRWSLINEAGISYHEVERSVDGIHFITVSTVNSAANRTATTNYYWVDLQPATGIYYYRIKSTGLYGAIAYSETVKVKMVRSTPGIYVFPNPVTDGIIHLQLNVVAGGVYSVRLFNAAGQELMKQSITHPGGNATHSITPAQVLISGTYGLKVISPVKRKSVIKVLIQ